MSSPLLRELNRLYRIGAPPDGAAAADAPLVDTEGRVRVLVIGAAGPQAWAALMPLWQGVQVEWGWPAPGIAVCGDEGLQLWFSLAEPAPAAEATRCLAGLREHHLATWPAAMLQTWPAGPVADAAALRPVPAALAVPERWSAFVAPDLAPVFADEPWLDLPPSEDGQAQVLSMLASIPRCDFEQALGRLQARPSAERPAQGQPGAARSGSGPQDGAPGTAADEPAHEAATQARRFLLSVMNDHDAPLTARIEAAKALLAAARP